MKSKTASAIETELMERLDALTAEIQAHEPGENALGQEDGIVDLVQGLQRALPPVAPRADFARELRHSLLEDAGGVVGRMKRAPARRVSLAAALALAAGCLLWLMRRLAGSDAPAEMQEEAVASSA